MNWDAIGAVGEIVGAAAVVLTLGYLGYQTHQSTRAARSDARQRILDSMSDAQANFLGDENNRNILSQGLEDPHQLRPADYLLFTHWLFIFGNNLFNAIRLRDEGILDEAAFHYISNAFVGCCKTRGGAIWWRESFQSMPEPLVSYVNDTLADETEIPDIGKLLHVPGSDSVPDDA